MDCSWSRVSTQHRSDAAVIRGPLVLTFAPHVFVCVFSVLSVLSASPLNSYGSKHWQSLGFRQNYFDSFGVFMSVLASMPLILTSFGILIHAIYHASSLLILVKRKQLGIDKKGPKKEAAATLADTNAASSSVPSEAVRAGDVDGQSPPSPIPSAGVKQRKSAKAR